MCVRRGRRHVTRIQGGARRCRSAAAAPGAHFGRDTAPWRTASARGSAGGSPR